MAGAAVAGISLAFAITVISAGGVSDLILGLRSVGKTTYRSPRQWKYLRRARALETANVARDVEQALQRNDHRLKAIDYSGELPFLDTPGVDNPQELRRQYGVSIVASTSDVVFGAEQRRFERAASEYAKRYNSLLCSRLRTK